MGWAPSRGDAGQFVFEHFIGKLKQALRIECVERPARDKLVNCTHQLPIEVVCWRMGACFEFNLL